jgi:hydrogenase nickel incorporation protein HypA/HybF
LAQVAEIAHQRGAQAVKRITIEMGPLCGVEPGLLINAFSVMRRGGVAAAADLVIEAASVRVRCLACGADSEARINRMICAACGGFRTRVTSGDELRLLKVELRVPEPLMPALA